MKPLAQRTQRVRSSGIRQMMELARQLPDVIHLETGEPDVNTSESIIAGAMDAARAGFTKYTASAGLRSLREAISRKLRDRNGLSAGAEQVVVTPGAVFALAAAMMTVVDPGDEVLVPDPGWPNFTSIVDLLDGHPIPYPLRRANGFVPDPGEIGDLMTPRTKLIVVNTPANPTGAVFPPGIIRAILTLAAKHDAYILSDEVYEDFVYEGVHQSTGTVGGNGRVISVFGFSKSYAMTGWRLGYAVASPDIAATMTLLAEPLVSCPSSVAQKAAETALVDGADDIALMRESYRARRDAVVRMLAPEGLLAAVPAGAFYALVDMTQLGEDSMTIARRLLEEEHVASVPGEAFGQQGRGLLRISFATAPPLLEEGCRRIVRFSRRWDRRAQPEPSTESLRTAMERGRTT